MLAPKGAEKVSHDSVCYFHGKTTTVSMAMASMSHNSYVITRGWPLLAALLERSEASTQAMWPIVARKGQQMQSSKKPGRWLKTFRTKKCGPEGSAWHISSPAATVLQLHMLHCSESFFIDDYDDFSVPSQAAIYIKIMQKIKEKGEAHQHGDVFRSELVLFFCDTLVDTC